MLLSWYVATIILKCQIAGESSSSGVWTCIQQIHLLRASQRNEAYDKALALGKSEEHEYLNAEGQTVSWIFVGLENLEELTIESFQDGMEIWGRVFESNSPEALVTGKDGLTVYYMDEIGHLTADEILQEGFQTRLVCNRVRFDGDN
jgi:hypothetical protein